ncbi:MAG: LysR family transcriptional regulator [Sterolibacterium sp.]|jgi:DNA-binding transcriptional LysR family regulator
MSIPRFTAKQLDAFVAVADLLSFAGASARLSLTSSAVSQLIGELEEAVGIRLFDRSTRRVSLSAAGREFLPSAETVLRHLRLAESAASDIRNGVTGLVRVAAPLVLAGYFLPPAIKAFTERHPGVVVRIRDVSVEQLEEVVAMADADMAIGPDRSANSGVTRHPVFLSPWVVWCAPEHPLAAKRTITWRDLRNQALVAASTDHERTVSRLRQGASEDYSITPIDVVQNISTALGLAASNLAATVSPAYVNPLATSMGLVMRRILKPEAMRQVSLYLPLRRTVSASTTSFVEFLLKWKSGYAQRVIIRSGM